MIWFEVLSELFVNIAAAWFIAVFVESRINTINSVVAVSTLIIKFGLGIMSLFAAKYFRERAKRRKR